MFFHQTQGTTPSIHVLFCNVVFAWMAGSRPAMTKEASSLSLTREGFKAQCHSGRGTAYIAG